MTDEVLSLARIVWDYHQLGHRTIPAEVIVAFGTNDLRVAEFAAELFLEGFGSTLVCTGGVAHQGDLLQTAWEQPEAEVFAEVAVRRGVPRDHILLETRALNTSENVRYTRELLSRNGNPPCNAVIAVKPFMQRRAWAAWAVEWPEMPATVASPQMTLDEYFTAELTPEKIVNIMLGDLQRIWVYAERGWSAPQCVPPEVMQAYGRLVALGFTQHLVPQP